MDRSDLRADESLTRLHGRIARIDDVTAAIAQWTATRTREEVSALCQKHHVAAAPVRDVLEVLRDPHLHARGFLTDHAGHAGPVALPNSPIRYDGSAMLPLKSPPRLGEHTEAVLTSFADSTTPSWPLSDARGVIPA
jgi:crotonobetainyl-CoA:carnitine CoA-transferase CaiB-like acyl-CoA transferase